MVVLVLAAAAFLILRDGDEPVADDDVSLLAITDAGENPWTDNLDVGNDDLDRLDIVLEDVPSLDEDDRDKLGIAVDGDEAGLNGGVRDELVCDKDEIAGQLTDDDDKTRAFAEVEGIDDGDIGDFVDDLTGVLLRHDTRLADHGFVDGSARRVEAVLERGTAVLVDEHGVPRVRCASGSPLSAARSTADTERFSGTEWPGFDKNRVVVVEGAAVDDAFVLLDNDTEDVFLRPVGSAGEDDQPAPVELACLVNPDSATCLGGQPDRIRSRCHDDDRAGTGHGRCAVHPAVGFAGRRRSGRHRPER